MAILLDEIKELIAKHPEANLYEIQCLRFAGDLLIICKEHLYGEKIPPSEWPLLTIDEYDKMPGRFELIYGRLRPRDWDLYLEPGHGESEAEESR